MRQVRALVERGWEFKMKMDANGIFHASVNHQDWGETIAEGKDLTAIIGEMFKKAKVLEKQWLKC